MSEVPLHWPFEGYHLTESVRKVVLQKSISAKNRQRILYMSENKGQVDGFVEELTFAKQLDQQFL